MAKQISRFIIIFTVVSAAALIGCSTPESNPVVPPSQYRDGNLLDFTADFIPKSGSPYLIPENAEDWVIEAGRTVTIEAGTVIMVAGRKWIDIDGKLIARGTAQEPIHFTTANTSPDYGQWRGLKFDNPAESSEIEHCIFTYGAFFDTDTLTDRGRDAQHYRGMLAIRNSSPIIRHCICYYNQNNGVYIEGADAAPSIRYSIFTGNDASGIRADTSVNVAPGGSLDISYNCVAENSAPPFIMGFDTIYWGQYDRINYNIDSCDFAYNIDLDPLLTDPQGGILADQSDFSLQSCSPCIDAGEFGAGINDPEDMGAIPYVRQNAELRGRASGVLEPTVYTLSCNIVIPDTSSLVIPAGCRIEASGLYTIRVLGSIDIQGTVDNRVVICPCAIDDGDALWGGITIENRETSGASAIRYTDIERYSKFDLAKPGTVLEGVRFIDGYSYGLNVTTGSLEATDAVTLTRCEFSNCGAFAVEAVLSAISIRNVQIVGTKGRGIVLFGCDDRAEIYNTVVSACSTTALYMMSGCNPDVYNNVFSECGYYGMEISDNCNPIFINNIVTGNGHGGIRASRVCAPTLYYNDAYRNGMRDGSETLNYINAGIGGTFLIVDETSLSADPLLNADFTLAGGSPCINAGDPNLLDPDGSRSDMGAFGGPGGNNVGLLTGRRHHVASR